MKRTAALALALGLAYGFSLNAAAFGLEQKGQPQASVGTLPTYGLEVPTRTALKTVIPAGWQLFVHQSVKLPGTVNWKVGDLWPQVLGGMAESAGLAVLVDWDTRTVLIRSQDVAVQERATRAEIAQAAITPLPKFTADTETSVAPAPKSAAAAPAQPTLYAVNTKVETPSAPDSLALTTAPAQAVPAKPLPETPSAPGAAAHVPLVDTKPAEVKRMDTEPAPPVQPVAVARPVEPLPAPAAAPVSREATSVAAELPPRAATVLNALLTTDVAKRPDAVTPVEGVLATPRSVAKRKPSGKVKPTPTPQPVAAAPAPIAAAVPGSRSTEPGANREQFARDAAARAATGVPHPYNDVMPAAREGTFTFNEPAPAAVAAPVPRQSGDSGLPAAVQPARGPVVMPVIRTNPTPAMVATQEAAAARAPSTPSSSDAFGYVAPAAWNKPQVRRIAQGIASKYGYRLVWVAADVQLRGPVTLLANSLAEDLMLLKKAMGPTSVAFEVDEANKYLLVAPAASGLAAARARAASEAQTAARTPDRAEDGSPATVPASRSAEKPKLTFTVLATEPLETALVRFVRAQGYTIEWKVPGGFEAKGDKTYEGASLVQVLSQVLPPLGVSADVYTHDKHIVVRPGEARDK